MTLEATGRVARLFPQESKPAVRALHGCAVPRASKTFHHSLCLCLCRALGGRDGGGGPACSLHLGGPRLPRRRRCSLSFGLWSLRADSEFTRSGCSSFSSCIYVIVVRGLERVCASVTMHSVEYRRSHSRRRRSSWFCYRARHLCRRRRPLVMNDLRSLIRRPCPLCKVFAQWIVACRFQKFAHGRPNKTLDEIE